MARREQVELEYIAKIDKLERELQKLPGISAKQARGMVKGLDQQLRAQTRATRRAAAAHRAMWSQAGDGAEGVKRIFDAAGGAAGSAAGQVEHLTRSASALWSVMGAGGLAAGLLLAISGGAVKAALSTSDLVEEMMEAERHVPVSDDALYAVREMDRQIEGLQSDLKELVVIVGSEVAPAIGGFVGWLRDGVDTIRDVNTELENTATTAGTIKRAFEAVISFGLSEFWAESAEGAGDYARRVRESKAAIQELMAGHDEIGAVAVRKTEDMSAAHRTYLDSLREEQRAQRELEALYRDSAVVQLTAQEKIIAAHDERIAKIGELVVAGAGQFEAAAARHASERQMAIELSELYQQQAEDYRQLQEKRRAEAKKTADEVQAAAQAEANAWFAATSQSVTAIQLVADHYARTSDNMTAEAKDRARAFFVISKAAAVAQIAINTAQAVMQSFAQYGPTPLGYFSAAAMAATGLVQGGIAASEPMPEFPVGGLVSSRDVSPDHFPIAVQEGEAVMNRPAVARMGGREGVDAMNQGRAAPGTIVVENWYRHRMFDSFIKDNLKRGGPLTKATRSRVGHSAYRRGR